MQETAADYARRKLDVQHLEALAEKAAALTAMINEFRALHPVPEDVLNEKILKEWACGSDRIDVELNAALLDKADSFEVAANTPCFKALLDQRLTMAPVTSVSEANLRDALKQDLAGQVPNGFGCSRACSPGACPCNACCQQDGGGKLRRCLCQVPGVG